MVGRGAKSTGGGSGDGGQLLSELPEVSGQDTAGKGDEVRVKETGWTRKTELKLLGDVDSSDEEREELRWAGVGRV